MGVSLMAEIGTFLASGSSRRHPAERPHAIVTVVDARSLTLTLDRSPPAVSRSPTVLPGIAVFSALMKWPHRSVEARKRPLICCGYHLS